MVASRRAAEVAARREPRRCAPLLPAVAEAAARAGARKVGLVALGPAGLETDLDRVHVAYEVRDGNGEDVTLGDVSSPVRATCTVVGPGRVPGRPLVPVAARVRLDPDPVEPPEDGSADRGADRGADTLVVRAGLVDGLPAALDRVPADVLPVVVTAWTLSALAPPERLRLVQALDVAAADRPLAWVSVEGVGVAPRVPTLGDRTASGHSLVGLALLGGPRPAVETVGRCWSRGRLLSWFTARPR